MRAAPDAAGPSAPYFVCLEFDPTPSTIARFNRAHCWLPSASNDALLLAWFRRKEFNLVRFVAPIVGVGRTAFYREIETTI
jgi:hypothetical protein